MKTETIILDRCIKWIKEHQSDTHKKLPSENELADKLKVPRNVVRKAYEWLDLLGYTYSQQGKGRFIRARKKKINLVLSGVESFSEKIRGLGHHLDTQIITSKKIRFNEYIYNILQLPETAIVYKISRLRIVDGEPMAIHTSYLPVELFPNIVQDSARIDSLFAYHAANGYVNLRSNPGVLYTDYPTAKERKYLKCRNLVPLLVLESNCTDMDTNKVLEYTQIKYRSDCFDYIIG